MAIEGSELLQLIKSNPKSNASELAKQAGYITKTKGGQERVKMLAFQKAVMNANNITFRKEIEEKANVRGGRKANYRVQVQSNGNLLIGRAYTHKMGLQPGMEFEIQVGRKHLKLVLAGSGPETDE